MRAADISDSLAGIDSAFAERIRRPLSSPATRRIVEGLVRHRIAVIAILGAVHGLIDGLGYMNHDARIFGAAGRELLLHGSLDVFSDARIQVGPLHLLFNGAAFTLTEVLGNSLKILLAPLVEAAFTVAVVLTLRTLLMDRRRVSPGLEFFVGLTVVLGGLAWTAASSAHPAEGFIPLMLIWAARQAIRDKTPHAGVLVGAAASIKLWGIVGLPLLVLGRGFKKALMGAAIAVGIVAVLYAPFLAFGDVRTFSYEWAVKPQSPLGFFIPWNTTVTWWGRALQASVPLVGGCLLAFRSRGMQHAVWTVPLGIVALRLLSDPLDYHYYWLEVGTIALIGLAILLPQRPTVLAIPVAFGFFVTLWPFYFLTGHILGAWISVVSIAILILVWPRRSRLGDRVDVQVAEG